MYNPIADNHDAAADNRALVIEVARTLIQRGAREVMTPREAAKLAGRQYALSVTDARIARTLERAGLCVHPVGSYHAVLLADLAHWSSNPANSLPRNGRPTNVATLRARAAAARAAARAAAVAEVRYGR